MDNETEQTVLKQEVQVTNKSMKNVQLPQPSKQH
jgi:hypothetical protein